MEREATLYIQGEEGREWIEEEKCGQCWEDLSKPFNGNKLASNELVFAPRALNVIERELIKIVDEKGEIATAFDLRSNANRALFAMEGSDADKVVSLAMAMSIILTRMGTFSDVE